MPQERYARIQVVWDEENVFHGATPSSPLNKLALHIGRTLPHNGMQVRWITTLSTFAQEIHGPSLC